MTDSRHQQRTLRVCLVDMNDGHANQAMRCLRGIVARFFDRIAVYAPDVACSIEEISPRNTLLPVPRDCDLYLSSGGPGSPFDGDGTAWAADYDDFLDVVAESATRGGPQRQALFGICYSFELIVRHFELAMIAPRAERKFGVMPIYTTPEGQADSLLGAFGDRLFAFEHRNWEAIELDRVRLAALGGELLAQESRDGMSKGRAILGLKVMDGIEAVQFHPEADRAGVVNWVSRPDQAAAFKATYGDVTYQAMLRTLDDPRRLARTYALIIPGWLTRNYNALARARGYRELPPPPEDGASFGPPALDAIANAQIAAAANG
jgi:GMP synthase-like glutamine amidotransferase